jgi:hypothetical protein
MFYKNYFIYGSGCPVEQPEQLVYCYTPRLKYTTCSSKTKIAIVVSFSIYL